MRLAVRSLPLLVLLLAAACSVGSRPRGPLPPPQARTTVRVENRNFLDMNVFVVNGAQRTRLGAVSGLSTRVLTIPANSVFGVSSLRFVADPVGAKREVTSWELAVRPGQQVRLIIPNG